MIVFNTLGMRIFYVYILTNKYNTVLYVGVTNDLERRCNEHKKKIFKGFTQKYNVDKLVYYEQYDSLLMAIEREKQIKAYGKVKKIALIEKVNPEWEELFIYQRIKPLNK